MEVEAPVGSHVRVRTILKEVFEGFVYTEDKCTNTLFILSALVGSTGPSSSTCSLRMINREYISDIELLQSADEDENVSEVTDLPHITQQQLASKELKTKQDVERAHAQLNENATEEGQLIFDALAKTMTCEWHGLSIVIYDQIRIDPPYFSENCHKLLNCPAAALKRIRKVLDGERRKLQSRSDSIKQINSSSPKIDISCAQPSYSEGVVMEEIVYKERVS